MWFDGKCLSISVRNFFLTFVDTSLLNGEPGYLTFAVVTFRFGCVLLVLEIYIRVTIFFKGFFVGLFHFFEDFL